MALEAHTAPADTATRQSETQANRPPKLLRYALAGAFVAAWMAIGFILQLDPNTYLIVGVPLTVLFQLAVARRPLLALWVNGAPTFKLDRLIGIVAVVLAPVPIWIIVRGVERQSWVLIAYGALALVGAVGAGYALRAFDRRALDALKMSLLVAGGIGVALLGLTIVGRGGLNQLPPPVPLGSFVEFGTSLLQYTAVVFVLEEVFFRGALDSYLQEGERDMLSAVFVSALWGIWHVPLTFEAVGFAAIPGALGVHIAIGIPLSQYYRRGGQNLAVPGITHAFINAVRNALGLQ